MFTVIRSEVVLMILQAKIFKSGSVNGSLSLNLRKGDEIVSLFSTFKQPVYAVEEVVNALSTLRICVVRQEFDLHSKIESALKKQKINYQKEFRIGPGKRIDFIIPGGIGIEVKKSRPEPRALTNQLEKYLSSPELTSLILVLEKSILMPDEICGKPIRVVSTNALWGLSV